MGTEGQAEGGPRNGDGDPGRGRAFAASASPAAAQTTPCALEAVCEAETGTLHDGAGTETEHAGYTGTGFVDQLTGNAGVVLRVNAAEAGTHRVTVRYANANPGTGLASRRFTITVNGTTHVPVLFPVTASWSTWSTVAVLVPLTAGTNTVDLRTGPDNNGPDQHRPHRRGPRHHDHRAGRDAAHLQRQHGAAEALHPQARADAQRRRAAADDRLDHGRRLGVLHRRTTSRRWSPTSRSRRPAPTRSGCSATTARNCGSTASRSSTTTASTAPPPRTATSRSRPARTPWRSATSRSTGGARAAAAVAPPGPDHLRDGPELRVLGRGRRRARRRARHQGVRERGRPAGRRLAAADGPPQLHAEQPAPDRLPARRLGHRLVPGRQRGRAHLGRGADLVQRQALPGDEPAG